MTDDRRAEPGAALYGPERLRILGTAPLTTNRFFSGEYRDELDRVVGSYVTYEPAERAWNGQRAIAVTDVLDRAAVFMRIVRRRARALGRDEYVVVDPDGTAVGLLQPKMAVGGRRLRATIALEGLGGARIEEEDHVRQRGVRRFLVFTDEGLEVAVVSPRFEGNGYSGMTQIQLEHSPEASPPWRCTSIAIATCLPQLGVGSYVQVSQPDGGG